MLKCEQCSVAEQTVHHCCKRPDNCEGYQHSIWCLTVVCVSVRVMKSATSDKTCWQGKDFLSVLYHIQLIKRRCVLVFVFCFRITLVM